MKAQKQDSKEILFLILLNFAMLMIYNIYLNL